VVAAENAIHRQHYRVRYRDWSGRQQAETFSRAADAERRKAEVETELAGGTWRDPRRGEMRLNEWAGTWIETRHDLRVTTWARLETTMRKQLLPKRVIHRMHDKGTPIAEIDPHI
jgi:hypothetical protein